MSHRIFIHNRRRAEATTSGATGPGAVTLPRDLLAEANRRLSIGALIYAACFTIAYGFGRFIFEPLPGLPIPTTAFNVYDVVSVLAIVLSLGFALVVYRGWLPPLLALDLGLVYWALGVFAIDIPNYHFILQNDQVIVGLSWSCIWIVVFPMLVPNSPGKIALAAVVTAFMGPLALMTNMLWLGVGLPEFFRLGDILLAYTVCAAMAWISSRVIYRLGHKIREAREMGSYRLLERLGEGGMGEVWLARHRLLARPAAVKLLKPEMLGAGAGGDRGLALARFEREAKATATLRSPHTVQLYDFGLTDDGVCYYAMELLAGIDLDTLIKRYGPIPAGRVVHILDQVCDSLAEAHGTGLVHRDIKPGNIVVCRLAGMVDFVKVLDFGLVQTTSAGSEEDTRLTREGVTLGTPSFMAPEAATGSSPTDARSDIYALGCVAYWLLTGENVFAGATPMEQIVAHVREPASPPSTRTELPIPGSLERIVLACLEKDPGKRPGSVRELDEMLANCTVDEPWTRQDARTWWELHRPEQFGVA